MDRVLLFAAAVSPAILMLEYGRSKTRGSWTNEALWTAFLVGAVGALAAMFVEAGLNYLLRVESLSTLHRTAIEAVLITAIPEEGIKFFVLVGVAERHVDARRSQDTIVLALAVGLGFAALENLLYLVQPGEWMSLAATRALTAVPGHGIDGLAMGSLLTLARLGSGRQCLRLTISLVIPIFLHAFYDFPLFAIENNYSSHANLLLLWFAILIASAILGIVLCNRALRISAAADRATGRDCRPPAPPIALIGRGAGLVGASIGLAAVWHYSRGLSAPWVGTILGILPIAMGLDLIIGGFSQYTRNRENAPPPRTFVVYITAVVVSNVAYAAIFFGIIFTALPATAIVTGMTSREAATVIKSASAYYAAIPCLGYCAGALGAGYIAGRMAKRRHRLNGLLATSIAMLLALYDLVNSGLGALGIPATASAVVLYTAQFSQPLLGILGGWLAQLRQARNDSSAQPCCLSQCDP